MGRYDEAYLHIQTGTPAGQRPGLRSSSAGPFVSCRKDWPTQSGTQGLDPEPESPAASGGRTPSGGAALWKKKLIKTGGRKSNFTDYIRYNTTIQYDKLLPSLPAASATADPTMAPIALLDRAAAICKIIQSINKFRRIGS